MSPEPDVFATSWHAAWQGIGGASPDDAQRVALQARYAEPHRAYHTLQHLGECLGLLDRHAHTAERPAEVALALWFHDAVYDVQAHDNEAQSADWARTVLLAQGAATDVAERVHALVMATRHDALPTGPDATLLVDIDLAILGAPPQRFAEYERQIRLEYAHVPPDVFEPRRRELLARFLQRDPLYRTAGLRATHGLQARDNLRAAIGTT